MLRSSVWTADICPKKTWMKYSNWKGCPGQGYKEDQKYRVRNFASPNFLQLCLDPRLAPGSWQWRTWVDRDLKFHLLLIIEPIRLSHFCQSAIQYTTGLDLKKIGTLLYAVNWVFYHRGFLSPRAAAVREFGIAFLPKWDTVYHGLGHEKKRHRFCVPSIGYMTTVISLAPGLLMFKN